MLETLDSKLCKEKKGMVIMDFQIKKWSIVMDDLHKWKMKDFQSGERYEDFSK
jgi:hypothetical protein